MNCTFVIIDMHSLDLFANQAPISKIRNINDLCTAIEMRIDLLSAKTDRNSKTDEINIVTNVTFCHFLILF